MIVYRLTCLPTGKIYVGITRRPLERRIARHFSDANRGGFPTTRLLVHEMRRYQRSFWVVEVLATTDDFASLLRLEKEFIARYRATNPAIGYNRTIGGQGTLGCRHPPLSDDRRVRLSEFQAGRTRSAETRQKVRESMLRMRKETPERFGTTANPVRDCAIARAYAAGVSVSKVAPQFGITPGAAWQAIERFRIRFKYWMESANEQYVGMKVPMRVHVEWIDAMEQSL